MKKREAFNVIEMENRLNIYQKQSHFYNVSVNQPMKWNQVQILTRPQEQDCKEYDYQLKFVVKVEQGNSPFSHLVHVSDNAKAAIQTTRCPRAGYVRKNCELYMI